MTGAGGVMGMVLTIDVVADREHDQTPVVQQGPRMGKLELLLWRDGMVHKYAASGEVQTETRLGWPLERYFGERMAQLQAEWHACEELLNDLLSAGEEGLPAVGDERLRSVATLESLRLAYVSQHRIYAQTNIQRFPEPS